MLARRDGSFGAADADANAVGEGLDLVGLNLPVEPGIGQLEPDLDPAAAGRPIFGREIAIDAVVDRDVFDTDVDCLGDVERAVTADRDIAVEAQDALLGRRGSSGCSSEASAASATISSRIGLGPLEFDLGRALDRRRRHPHNRALP